MYDQLAKDHCGLITLLQTLCCKHFIILCSFDSIFKVFKQTFDFDNILVINQRNYFIYTDYAKICQQTLEYAVIHKIKFCIPNSVTLKTYFYINLHLIQLDNIDTQMYKQTSSLLLYCNYYNDKSIKKKTIICAML